MNDQTPPESKRYPSRRRTPRPRRAELYGTYHVRFELSGRRRLGRGELVDERLSRQMAQFWFFEAIYDVVPWVYESLKEHVFPSYHEFFQEAAGREKPTRAGDEEFVGAAHGRFNSFCYTLPGPPPTRAPFEWAKLCASEPLYPSLSPLKAWLSGWAEYFHLTDSWCLDTALCTLLQLEMNELLGLPEAYQMTRFSHPGLSLPAPPCGLPAQVYEPPREAPPSTGPIFWPMDAPYNPFQETRAEAKVRLLPSMGEDTDAYLARVEAACAGAQRAKLRKEMHFKWLAFYQCLSEPARSISSAGPWDLSTVVRSIHELARLLDLDLRRSSRGRTKGVKEKWSRHRNS